MNLELDFDPGESTEGYPQTATITDVREKDLSSIYFALTAYRDVIVQDIVRHTTLQLKPGAHVSTLQNGTRWLRANSTKRASVEQGNNVDEDLEFLGRTLAEVSKVLYDLFENHDAETAKAVRKFAEVL